MRIVAMTNEGQLSMMKNMLNSAMKAGFPMNNFHCYILNQDKEAASYNTKEFQSLTLKKLEVILSNMYLDKEVLWIDNDIYIFQNMINELRTKGGHFVMQDDLWSPCTGFFLVRSSSSSIRAIQRTIQIIRNLSIDGNIQNDQHVFNKVYKTIPTLIVQLLSQDEYPNGDVYFTQNRKLNAKMVHNNYLGTTNEKIVRFKDHALWDESDAGYDLANKYFI